MAITEARRTHFRLLSAANEIPGTSLLEHLRYSNFARFWANRRVAATAPRQDDRRCLHQQPTNTLSTMMLSRTSLQLTRRVLSRSALTRVVSSQEPITFLRQQTQTVASFSTSEQVEVEAAKPLVPGVGAAKTSTGLVRAVVTS